MCKKNTVVLQQGLMNASPTEQPSMSDSQLLEDRDSLEVERKLFKEQKANFDEERRVFTDAAIRLGREVGKIFIFFFGPCRSYYVIRRRDSF